MVKRILSIALTAVLVIPAALAAVPLSVAADELPVYQASEEYVAAVDYNPTAHWEWDYYDYADESYHKLEYFNERRGFSIISPNTYGNVTAVNATTMYPDHRTNGDGGYTNNGNTTYNNAWARYIPVRTFTAPKSGNITITADGGITGGAGTAGPSVRILLERGNTKTNIWPGDSYNKQTLGVTDFTGWREIYQKDQIQEFEPLTLNVRAGDKLRFEMSAEKRSNAAIAQQHVDWDPIVSYNSFIAIADFQPSVTDDLPLSQVFTITTEDEMDPITESDVSISGTTSATVRALQQSGNTMSFAFDGLAYSGTYEVEVRGLKPVGSSGTGEIYRFSFTTITLKQYQASDYYDTDGKSNPQTVDGEAPWTWESYDLKTKTYTPLPKFNTARGYAIVDNYNAVTAVGSSAMYGDTRQDGQGGFVADETYTYAWQRYYPVRTFTVPESGKVTLSAAGGTITAPSSAAPNLRILLERSGEFTQLWPEDGWKAVNASAPVRFTPLVQNVVEGDKLHFELSAADASTGNCWNMYAYWDPVVSYNEKHPTVTGISPENGAVDVPGNTEFVMTFAQEICEPSVYNAEIEGDAAVADVWLKNGNEVHILLDSTTLKEKTSYTIKLKNIRLKNLNEPNSFEQCITFTTANYTVFGEFSRSGASVVLPINNTLEESRPVSVTMIAALCQGTPEHYTIKSARYQTEVITGKRDMTITLDAVPGSGEFVKAALVTAPAFGKLLTDMAILE